MRYARPMAGQDNHLLSFLVTTVETMRDQMATKDDITRLASTIETMRGEMATKQELADLESRMATKLDLAELESRMITKLDLADARIDTLETRIDIKLLAIRGDIEQVQVRLDSIDHALSGRMGMVESEVSRLRSVVYLLVKDRPEILRLLGQPLPESQV